MLQILHRPTLICVSPSHPWGQARVRLLRVGRHFLQASCAQLSSAKPLGRCSIQSTHRFPAALYVPPDEAPHTQPRNAFLSSSQGPTVSIFPYLPTHPAWPPIQLPSIVGICSLQTWPPWLGYSTNSRLGGEIPSYPLPFSVFHLISTSGYWDATVRHSPGISESETSNISRSSKEKRNERMFML